MVTAFPKEPKLNDEVLKPMSKPLNIYFGANSWGRTDWIGEVYPEGTKDKDFLQYYAKYFNAVELNATHYKDYTYEEIKKWAYKAEGRNFLFCPKVPQSISHYSSFVNTQDKTKVFLESILAFGDHLGPVVLQVSNKFSPKRKENLYNYLGTLPPDIQFFLEVRNPEWFEDGVYEEHLEILKTKNIGSVINDTPEGILNLGLSLPKCFIRYTPTRNQERVQQWFHKIQEWGTKGLTEAYFFVQPQKTFRSDQKESTKSEFLGSLRVEKNLQLEALTFFKQLCKEG